MVLNPILGIYSAILTYLCRVRVQEELGEGRMSMLLLGGCTSWCICLKGYRVSYLSRALD